MPRQKKKISYYSRFNSTVQNFNYTPYWIRVKNRLRGIGNYIQRKPFTSFFILLGILLLLIIAGNILLKPKNPPPAQAAIKEVQFFKVGSAPKIKVQAQVEKSGVIKIVAIAPGVIDSINVSEGDSVERGTNLISIATNYSGGNVLAISASIAGQQFNLAKSTYNDQKELIAKQREVANKTQENAAELREISSQSASDTQSLLDLNQSILDQINTNLDQLNATNSGGLSNPIIFQTTQLKSQLQSAVTQLRAQLRNLQFQGASDKPPAELVDLQKEIALKQLDIQQKTLDINLNIAGLQFSLASVNAESMHPTAPFPGVIDKIHVKVGQYVVPGTVLFSLSGDTQHVKVVAKVPRATAMNVSMVESSQIHLNSLNIFLAPSYISRDSTDGQLYSVIYQLDDSYKNHVTDTGFITVDMPIGTGDTTNAVPFIPLDAVFQTQQESYVYIVGKDKKAVAKKVVLGQVQGSFVEVLSGLPPESTIILSRNVVEGDVVRL